MPAARRFEELRMWQRARQLANLVYELTGQPSFRDAGLRNQMRRAAVSIMSNIAEGFGRGSNEELDRFLFIAKGSGTELLSQLYLSLDLNYITKTQFQEAQRLCDDTARLMQAFTRAMKGARKTSFRRRRQQVPWAEKVEQVMKEIQEASKENKE